MPSLGNNKILWLANFSPTSVESAANRLRNLSKGLKNEKTAVYWCYPETEHESLSEFFIPIKISSRANLFDKIKTVAAMTISALRWIRKNPDGIVICSVPPSWLLFSSFFISLFYPKRLVMDYRDPLLSEKLIKRPWLVDKMVEGLQNFVTARCFKIVLASPGISEYLNRQSELHTVLSGFDPSETRPEAKRLSTEKIICLYGGTFYGTRSPMPLLKALYRFRQENLKAQELFHFVFLAQFNVPSERAEVEEYINTHDLKSSVEIKPVVSKIVFIEEMARADVLLVVTHSEGSEYAIPGKIFDYVAARKPMALITSDPILKSLMKEVDVPCYGAANDEGEIFRMLERISEECSLIKSSQSRLKSQTLSCLYQGAVLNNALFGSPK